MASQPFIIYFSHNKALNWRAKWFWNTSYRNSE